MRTTPTTTFPLSVPETEFLQAVEKAAIAFSVLPACVMININPVLAANPKPEYENYKQAVRQTDEVSEKLRVWAMRMKEQKWLPSSLEEIQSAITLTASGYQGLLNFMLYYKNFIGRGDFVDIKNETEYLDEACTHLETLRDTLILYKKNMNKS